MRLCKIQTDYSRKFKRTPSNEALLLPNAFGCGGGSRAERARRYHVMRSQQNAGRYADKLLPS